MTIDNFKLLEGNFLQFVDNEFYFLQILQRKKENPEIMGNSKVIKTYYFNTLDKFKNAEFEIKTLCKVFNARAYIGVNRRSYEKIAFASMIQLTNLICNKQFEDVKNVYNTACGNYITSDKHWIIDVDSFDLIKLEKLKNYINKCRSGYKYNIILTVPTINGYHLITRPFDSYLDQLNKDLLNLNYDIHKNNPTLLYYSNDRL